ncbi:hypothetical protein H310_06976 [Aphanomyces invadans]|uniref:Uncharacterized protein n=1 Tax=Aphanomyces invadans TaxID=157072 RepID=A0A024U6G6_9STRA|nr:hypothetical protein H310_06976 [Aphanomyces invadans]ETW01462.1 hypothetical protein H310_06976 [Aphanomyces invadans]|eukprot:XP_008870460.1 hypothetical protein H310_06976 [Aphanomyces invadans]
MHGFSIAAAAAYVVATAYAYDFSSPLSQRVILSSSAKAFQVASVDGRTSLGDSCNSTLDCPSGTSCVAGSALEAVQSCVQDPVCGGNFPGNCPGLISSGQLVCAWSPVNASSCSGSVDSCTAFGGIPGIYKCYVGAQCESSDATTKAPLTPVTPSATSGQSKGPSPDQDSKTNWSTIIAVIVIIVAVAAIAVVAYLIVAKKKREREAAELRALINRDDENEGERVTTPKSAIQVL